MKIDAYDHQQVCNGYLLFENRKLKAKIAEAEQKAAEQAIQFQKLKSEKEKKINALTLLMNTNKDKLDVTLMKLVGEQQTTYDLNGNLKALRRELTETKKKNNESVIFKKSITFI